MDEDGGYKPPADFHENTKEPVVDLTINDSTELWLIQWPKDQNPDFNGQEVSLELHNDGLLGSFVTSSGKDYEVSSCAAQESGATVFVPSASGTKIVGKISRRVSLVHYPDPSELEERLISKRRRQLQESSAGKFATPSRSSVPSVSRSQGIRSASTHGSRPSSSIFSVGEPSQLRKKRPAPEPTRTINRTPQNSGRGHSVGNSSGQGHSGVSSFGLRHSAATSSGQGHSAATSSGQGHSAGTSSGPGQSKSKKKSKGKN